jgi:hypothetical protein
MAIQSLSHGVEWAANMNADCQEIAHDLLVLEPMGSPLPVVRTPRLRPLYYLHNFRLALSALKERYVDLLSANEAGFIESFDRLPESAQCLLTRLAMRKGPLFRRATLQYADVSDVEQALEELVALGWLDPDPLLCADDLCRVLNSAQLRLAAGIRRGRRPRLERPALKETQLALPLQDPPTIYRSLSDWDARLAGRVVHLCVDPLIKRLQLLFFGNHYQSWAEFVLVDLGVKRYESVAIDANARAFHSREEIDHFYRLNECRADLDAGKSASVVRESAFVPQAVSSWLRSRFMQLHVRIGELLEDEGNVELALQSYRECGAVDGLVRAVRLQVRLGLHEAAQHDALSAQQLSCSEAQQEAIDRALARMKRRHKVAPIKRMVHDSPEVIELLLPKLAGRQRIEIAVGERLSQPRSQLFYVENSLLTSLFGLLCWEALFAPVQGAFFHPFQAAPADLYTVEFRARRALHFRTLLELLDTGQHEAVIWRLYRAKAGICTNFVRWGKLKPGLLRLALQCIPASHLRLCFERYLDDLKENTSGMPDLIQFWPAERRYRLIEVKGPGDRLQDNQRRWFKFFAQHAIPAAVCQVRWLEFSGAGSHG